MSTPEQVEAREGSLRNAMSDPLFLADLERMEEDFKYGDAEADAQ